MEYKVEEKSAPGRERVEVLGATFEAGKPKERIAGNGGRNWRVGGRSSSTCKTVSGTGMVKNGTAVKRERTQLK